MQHYERKVSEAANFLKDAALVKPRIGILTGTGLGSIGQSLVTTDEFNYQQLPHFPLSTVTSHRGRLLMGTIAEKPTVVLQGRFHLYEGYTPLEVTFPIRVMQVLGVQILIVTNAAGGLNRDFHPGEIMIITDHINLTGANPLIGPNNDRWGDRFPDMSRAYDNTLSNLARRAAKDQQVAHQTGVYAGLQGPSLETPSEVRYLKTIGADAVGFSTVQEVIAAVHANMRVLGLSTITNVHDPDRPVPATVTEIIDVAQKAAPKLNAIIDNVLARH